MTLEEILTAERNIWGEYPITVTEMAVLIGVIAGDIARQARAECEGHRPSLGETGRELANLICSAVRWLDDLGLEAQDYITLALASQKRYAALGAGEDPIR